MGGGLGERVKKVKGLRGTNWLLQNSLIINIVNNSLMTMYGVRWVRDLPG